MGKIKYILFLAIYLVASQNVWSQKYEITYRTSYKPKMSDSSKVHNEYTLKLDADKKESIFTSIKENNPLNVTVYKNFNSNMFIKYESILKRMYKINYEFDAKNWKLKNSKKKINNYICRNAEISYGGRIWEAWYTNEIPMQDGPYIFSGLPGLIVEIYSLDEDYTFKLIGLEKKDDVHISKLVAVPFSNPQKEKEYKLEVIKDPLMEKNRTDQFLKSNNMSVVAKFDGKEITKEFTENRITEEFKNWMKAHDNPIEKGAIWIK